MAQIAIRMPKMSMTMTEGEVSEWFVEVGDSVAEGDVICEVLTDKVDMEVESPATGTISSIEVESGSVDVGTPIGYIEGDDSGGFGDLLSEIGDAAAVPAPQTQTQSEPADIDPPVPAASEPPSHQEPATPSSEPPREPAIGPLAAVPRARGLATEHGIDLANLGGGTGPDGLIVMADVESVVSEPASPRQLSSGPAGTRRRPESGPASTSNRTAQVRARVAAKMTESAAVPQFTVWRELVLDAASGHRGGISWTTVLLTAFAASLRDVPELLSRWDGNAPVDSGQPSIALAVDTPFGLLAPVFRSPDSDHSAVLDKRLRAVIVAAQGGKVDAAYLQAANATLSNLGGLGVDRFQALVTPPQASVLAVGSVEPRPVAVPGGLGTALTVTVGLTVDHRVADGAAAARLLAALDESVRHWRPTPAST